MERDLDLVAGGADGARFVLVSLAVALAVAILASRRGIPGARPLLALLDDASSALLAFERWVLDALTGAVSALTGAAAWTADLVDSTVLSAPADAVARRTARAGRAAAVLVVLGLGVFGAVLASGQARASRSPGASGAELVVSLPDGSRGPLVLTPGQGGWVGEMTLANQGTEPLVVSRVAIRGDEDDVRSPSRLTVHFVEGGGTSASIAPGASRDVVVAWMPEKSPRVRQAFGHVIVTSTDERAGEVAVGFRAQMPTGLGWIGDHALSLIVLLPLLMIPVAWFGPRLGPTLGRFVPCTSIVLATMRLLLALWACHKVSPIVTRADGNDGFQLVERAVWIRSIGSEWYLGVDGISVTLVVLVATLAVVAALVAVAEDRGGAHHAGLAILASALAAALLALDIGLLFAAWSIAIAALVALVGSGGGPRAAQAAAKTGAVGVLGATALLLAFAALASASEPAYLVDGTAVAHTTSIPELARTSFAAKPSLAGIPFVEGIWVLLLVAAASVGPAVPLHQWLPDALEQGPASAGILAAGGLAALGPYSIVRVGLGAVPEGAQWLGPTIAVVGVGAASWGALCALAQRSLRRFVAYATVAAGGAWLLGVGTLTPQGIAGAISGVFAHGLAAAMLLGAASALERRARTSDLPRLGGLAGDAPVIFGVLVVGLAVSAALPCTVAGWGLLLALLGSFTVHPGLGALLVAAALVGLAAHGRVARAIVFGPPDAEVRGAGLLASLGGRFPDATPAEVLAVVPLAAIAVLLGLWPAPLLSLISTAAHDASAAVPTAASE